MTEPVWYRLECLVENADVGSDTLWELGAGGVEVQDRETFMEGGTIAPVPEGTARLIAFFDLTDSDPSEFETRAESALSPRSLRLDRFEDTSWATAWKDYFHPVRLSSRSMVGPPWEDFEAPEGGLKLVIEPGLAFGTGTHETTQLVGELLDEALSDSPVESLLDVGCGSAILSMLARGLGVERVVGIDVDETAVGIAQDTIVQNGFDDIRLSTDDVGGLEATFPLVLANILGHILIDIRGDLIARLAPGGILLVSGVTIEQADAFLDDFGGEPLALEERRTLGEWTAFVFRRKP